MLFVFVIHRYFVAPDVVKVIVISFSDCFVPYHLLDSVECCFAMNDVVGSTGLLGGGH